MSPLGIPTQDGSAILKTCRSKRWKFFAAPRNSAQKLLALALCDVAPSLRRQIAGNLLGAEDPVDLANEPLYIARAGGQLRGAAWGQRQSGNIALFWPPQLEAGQVELTAYQLAEAVINDLDQTAIELTQVFLSAPDLATIKVLRHVGFRHVADLLYMSCESERFPLAAPEPCELEFVPYHGTQRGRLMQLIERTYEATLDCTALNGVRDIDQVINGYQGTGVFRPENWLFVRNQGRDVGLLLLADHPHAQPLGANVHGTGARCARTWLGQANYAICAVAGPRRKG